MMKLLAFCPKNYQSSSLFIRRGGSITCEVTGLRQYSHDLVQGRLEIPCLMHFEGDQKELDKLKGLIKKP